MLSLIRTPIGYGVKTTFVGVELLSVRKTTTQVSLHFKSLRGNLGSCFLLCNINTPQLDKVLGDNLFFLNERLPDFFKWKMTEFVCNWKTTSTFFKWETT